MLEPELSPCVMIPTKTLCDVWMAGPASQSMKHHMSFKPRRSVSSSANSKRRLQSGRRQWITLNAMFMSLHYQPCPSTMSQLMPPTTQDCHPMLQFLSISTTELVTSAGGETLVTIPQVYEPTMEDQDKLLDMGPIMDKQSLYMEALHHFHSQQVTQLQE